MSDGKELVEVPSYQEVGTAYISIDREDGYHSADFNCFEEGCGWPLSLPIDLNAGEQDEMTTVTCSKCGSKYTNRPIRLAIVRLRGRTGADYHTLLKDYQAEITYAVNHSVLPSITMKAAAVESVRLEDTDYEVVSFSIPPNMDAGLSGKYFPRSMKVVYQGKFLPSELGMKGSGTDGVIRVLVRLGPTAPWGVGWVPEGTKEIKGKA